MGTSRITVLTEPVRTKTAMSNHAADGLKRGIIGMLTVNISAAAAAQRDAT